MWLIFLTPRDKQTAQLTGFSQPQGLALDTAGNLYVADTGNSRIQVYAAGFTGTPTTINDPGESPASVAIDGNGNLAVTNILTTSGGAGSVSFFNKGGTLLSTLSNADFAKVIFDAFDEKGNLFIDGTNGSGAFVAGEIVGGVSGKAISILTTGNSVGYPGGIAISSKGKIAVDDQENIEIFTYNAARERLARHADCDDAAHGRRRSDKLRVHPDGQEHLGGGCGRRIVTAVRTSRAESSPRQFGR